MRSRRTSTAAAVGVLAVLLAVPLTGCGAYEPPDLTVQEPIRVDGSDPTPSDGSSATAEESPSATPTADTRPPAVRAAAAAADAGLGTPVALERLDERPSWTVSLVDGQGRRSTVVVVGDGPQVQGGPVVKVDEDDLAENRQLAAAARVRLDRAVALALRAAPGARLDAVTLDDDDGVASWEVELGDGRELYVDARTGVVRTED